MNEFWRWVAIVSLIILAIMMLSFLAAYQTKQLKRSDEQLNKAVALVKRLEEKLTEQKEK
jgi:membrane protein implicated in regulation of membrane protease activity